jgi:hypothetical protein
VICPGLSGQQSKRPITPETMTYIFAGGGAGLDSAAFHRVRKTFRNFRLPLTAYLEIDGRGVGYVTELEWPDAALPNWKRAFILRALKGADQL